MTEYDCTASRLEALLREMRERPGDFANPVQRARWAEQVEAAINELREVTAWAV